MPCKEEEDDSQISQNLNENLTEHEVVTWTVTGFLRPAGSKRAELERPLTASCAPLVLRRASSESGLQGDPSTGSGRDTVRVERVTSRTRESGSRFKAQSSKVEVRTVRDTVYIERVDTIEVQKLQGTSSSLNPHPSALNLIKWLFAIICAITVLIITIKVCLRRLL